MCNPKIKPDVSRMFGNMNTNILIFHDGPSRNGLLGNHLQILDLFRRETISLCINDLVMELKLRKIQLLRNSKKN